MSHFVVAAYTAAAVGATLAALLVGVALANRRLEDPHDMAYRDTALLAGGSLVAGVLFALLGVGWLGAVLGVPWPVAVALTLGGVLGVAGAASLVLSRVAYRYLRWSRTPAVLREDPWE